MVGCEVGILETMQSEPFLKGLSVQRFMVSSNLAMVTDEETVPSVMESAKAGDGIFLSLQLTIHLC